MIPDYKNTAPLLGAAGIAFLSFERQILMLLVFVFLVFMDCFTRWTAISSTMLRCRGEKNPGLWDAVKSIPEARRQGLIKSAVMKKQGMEKIILYNLSVLTSAATDFLLQSSGSAPFLMGAVVSYLAVTESLSIVENLSDAGVGNLGALANRFKGRI